MLSHKIKTMKCEQFGTEHNNFFGYKEQKGHKIHKHASHREEFKTTKMTDYFKDSVLIRN